MKSYASRTFIILLAAALCLANAGCSEEKQGYFQGYIEGEFLYVSSPIGGKLETLSVSRGMTVSKNDQLFILDSTVEAATVAQAEQGLQKTESRLADISQGMRPSEIKTIEARKEQARAVYDLAGIEFERSKQLLQQKAVAKEAVDRARAEMERSAAVVAQIEAELDTARLGARSDAVTAVRAEVKAAAEAVTQAQWQLDQKTLSAPQNALVFDTFYVEGEYVPAAHPVASLLPPGNIKVRFFVPEKTVGTLEIGQSVSIGFDGAQKTYTGTIAYISPQAEYTPPIIYSRESRSHLVFMIEAKMNPEDASALHPGQPVDVRLEAPNA